MLIILKSKIHIKFLIMINKFLTVILISLLLTNCKYETDTSQKTINNNFNEECNKLIEIMYNTEAYSDSIIMIDYIEDIKNIIYNTPDSIISINKKLDLLYSFVYFRPIPANSYRYQIARPLIEGFDVNNPNRDLYIIPIAICNNCGSELIDLVDISKSYNDLSSKYKNLYNVIFKLIEKERELNNYAMGYDLYRNLNFMIAIMFMSDEYSEKYPFMREKVIRNN